MAQGPNDPNRRDDSDDDNEGMPQDFQAMFNQLFGQLGGQGQQPEGMEELLAQVQRTLSQLNKSGQTFGGVGGINGLFGAGGPLGGPTEGGVNWDLAKDTARKTSLQLGPDPVPTPTQHERVREAVTIAEVWLDDVTDLVPGEQTTATLLVGYKYINHIERISLNHAQRRSTSSSVDNTSIFQGHTFSISVSMYSR